MQSSRKHFVWVRLDANRIANGEYFEQERQIVQRAVTRHLWVLPERVPPPACRSFDGSVWCVPIHSLGYARDASVDRREDTNRTRRGDPQKKTTTDHLVRLLLVYLETGRRNAGIRRRLGCRSQIYPVVVLRIRLECEILVIPQPDYQLKSTSMVSPRSSSLLPPKPDKPSTRLCRLAIGIRSG